MIGSGAGTCPLCRTKKQRTIVGCVGCRWQEELFHVKATRMHKCVRTYVRYDLVSSRERFRGIGYDWEVVWLFVELDLASLGVACVAWLGLAWPGYLT